MKNYNFKFIMIVIILIFSVVFSCNKVWALDYREDLFDIQKEEELFLYNETNYFYDMNFETQDRIFLNKIILDYYKNKYNVKVKIPIQMNYLKIKNSDKNLKSRDTLLGNISIGSYYDITDKSSLGLVFGLPTYNRIFEESNIQIQNLSTDVRNLYKSNTLTDEEIKNNKIFSISPVFEYSTIIDPIILKNSLTMNFPIWNKSEKLIDDLHNISLIYNQNIIFLINQNFSFISSFNFSIKNTENYLVENKNYSLGFRYDLEYKKFIDFSLNNNLQSTNNYSITISFGKSIW